ARCSPSIPLTMFGSAAADIGQVRGPYFVVGDRAISPSVLHPRMPSEPAGIRLPRLSCEDRKPRAAVPTPSLVLCNSVGFGGLTLPVLGHFHTGSLWCEPTAGRLDKLSTVAGP